MLHHMPKPSRGHPSISDAQIGKRFYKPNNVLYLQLCMESKSSGYCRRRGICYQPVTYPCLAKINTKEFKQESSFTKVKCLLCPILCPRMKLSAEEATYRNSTKSLWPKWLQFWFWSLDKQNVIRPSGKRKGQFFTDLLPAFYTRSQPVLTHFPGTAYPHTLIHTNASS